MSSVAIITARGGSKRIPRKNIKDFLGKPIIAYSIEVAIESGLFDEIMVSTEDEEIAEVAQRYGANVPFMRSPKNSDDYTGTVEVLLEVLARYKEQKKYFSYGCCIYPTAPFITVERLKEAYIQLKKKCFDTVFPVTEFSYPIQRALKVSGKGNAQMFQPENLQRRSQELEPAYHDVGQFYFFKIEKLLSNEQLWTENTGAIIIPELEAQDIDNESDWKIAEYKFNYLSDKIKTN